MFDCMHLNVRLCGMPPSALYFFGKSFVVFTDLRECARVCGRQQKVFIVLKLIFDFCV